MKPHILSVSLGLILLTIANPRLRADQLEMQNGDRYVGKILSVSADSVLLQSSVLGKISLPRNKVATLSFATNAVTTKPVGDVASAFTNLPDVSSLATLAKDNTNLAATAHTLSANPELVRMIREQLLAGSPEAAGKYDELVSGFSSGKLTISDIQREAKSTAAQMRKMKQELGPEVGESLDAYLEILDGFLKETDLGTSAPPAAQPKAPAR